MVFLSPKSLQSAAGGGNRCDRVVPLHLLWRVCERPGDLFKMQVSTQEAWGGSGRSWMLQMPRTWSTGSWATGLTLQLAAASPAVLIQTQIPTPCSL